MGIMAPPDFGRSNNPRRGRLPLRRPKRSSFLGARASARATRRGLRAMCKGHKKRCKGLRIFHDFK